MSLRRAEDPGASAAAHSRTWLVPSPPALPRATVTLVVGLASFVLFAALAVAIEVGRVPGLDSFAVPRLEPIRHVVRVVGEAGGATGTLLIIVGVVIVLVAARRPWSALYFGVAVACSASSPLLKDAFDRRGPPRVLWRPGDASFFPSGHAVGSMTVAAAVVTLAWQTRFRLVALATATMFALVVGFSAVLTGDHWPSDVVGGWALSIGWVSCVSSGTAAWAARRARRLTAAATPESIPVP